MALINTSIELMSFKKMDMASSLFFLNFPRPVELWQHFDRPEKKCMASKENEVL